MLVKNHRTRPLPTAAKLKPPVPAIICWVPADSCDPKPHAVSPVLYIGLFDSADCRSPLSEPVAFRHPGFPNKIQVNSVLPPWKQANEVDQNYLLPDLKSLVLLQKGSMTRSEIKRELILESHWMDGEDFEQRGGSRRMPIWLTFS